MEKAINNFIETFIEGSATKQVIYDNETKKWTIKYNYDVPDDEFNSVKSMIDFLAADQQG